MRRRSRLRPTRRWHRGWRHGPSPVRPQSTQSGIRAWPVLLSGAGAPVNGFAYGPGVVLGILGRRVHGHPALGVAAGTIDHSPCVSAWPRFPDRPPLALSVIEGFANLLVGVQD